VTTRLLLICPLLLATAAKADEIPFRFERTITVPERDQEELVAVPLDPDVFASTEDGLPDLRIHDAAGNEVPYLIRHPADTETVAHIRDWTASHPTLQPLDDGGLEIRITLDDDDPRPIGLCLDTPLKNFQQRIRVESSADGNAWQPLGQPAVLFDYSRYMDVRNVCVDFPETPHRHFRIVVDDVTAEQQSELIELTRRLKGEGETEQTERFTIERRPFRIDRVRFRYKVTTTRVEGLKQRDYPVAGFKVTQNEDRQTVVTIDTRREPLTALTIDTPDRNFSRHAVLQARSDNTAGRAGEDAGWQEIVSGTISRIDFKSLQQEQREIRFPQTRAGQYRLVIDNRDSPPIAIESIQATGNVEEVVFLARPDEDYKLLYGAEGSTAPDYDLAALKTMLQKGFKPSPGTLGPETVLSNAPPPIRWNDFLNSRRFLLTVIVILVVLLGWGLYQATRRIGTDEESSDAS